MGCAQDKRSASVVYLCARERERESGRVAKEPPSPSPYGTTAPSKRYFPFNGRELNRDNQKKKEDEAAVVLKWSPRRQTQIKQSTEQREKKKEKKRWISRMGVRIRYQLTLRQKIQRNQKKKKKRKKKKRCCSCLLRGIFKQTREIGTNGLGEYANDDDDGPFSPFAIMVHEYMLTN